MRNATVRYAEPADGFAAAEASLAGLVSRLQSADTAHMSHSDLEALLEQQGRELMRQLLQAHLDLRAQATTTRPVVGADGVARTHARHGTRPLETLLGTVAVTRAGHGARGHDTLFPVDAALNLPVERYSLGIRRRASEEATKGAFDEAVRVLTTQSGAHVAKRQVEEVVRRAAVDFDHFYFERRLAWPAETGASSDVLVLTFDGKGVPMRVEPPRSGSGRAQQADPALSMERSTRPPWGDTYELKPGTIGFVDPGGPVRARAGVRRAI